MGCGSSSAQVEAPQSGTKVNSRQPKDGQSADPAANADGGMEEERAMQGFLKDLEKVSSPETGVNGLIDELQIPIASVKAALRSGEPPGRLVEIDEMDEPQVGAQANREINDWLADARRVWTTMHHTLDLDG